MNNLKIKESIKAYKKYLEQNNQAMEDLKARKEKISFYQKFKKDVLLNLKEEEFVEFIGKLWASAIYGSKKYLVDKMISTNKGFENLKKMLIDFLYGEQELTVRWNKFLKSAKFFGPSYMSELLVYIYPEKYALANNQVLKALDYLELVQPPKYNYQFNGKKYLEICEVVKNLEILLKEENLPCENMLAVNYYLWEVANLYLDKQIDENISSDITPKEQEFIHDEIIEKIGK